MKRQQGIITAVVSLSIQRTGSRISILTASYARGRRVSVHTGMFPHAFHLHLRFSVHFPAGQHLPVLSICNESYQCLSQVL